MLEAAYERMIWLLHYYKNSLTVDDPLLQETGRLNSPGDEGVHFALSAPRRIFPPRCIVWREIHIDSWENNTSRVGWVDVSCLISMPRRLKPGRRAARGHHNSHLIATTAQDSLHCNIGMRAFPRHLQSCYLDISAQHLTLLTLRTILGLARISSAFGGARGAAEAMLSEDECQLAGDTGIKAERANRCHASSYKRSGRISSREPRTQSTLAFAYAETSSQLPRPALEPNAVIIIQPMRSWLLHTGLVLEGKEGLRQALRGFLMQWARLVSVPRGRANCASESGAERACKPGGIPSLPVMEHVILLRRAVGGVRPAVCKGRNNLRIQQMSDTTAAIASCPSDEPIVKKRHRRKRWFSGGRRTGLHSVESERDVNQCAPPPANSTHTKQTTSLEPPSTGPTHRARIATTPAFCWSPAGGTIEYVRTSQRGRAPRRETMAWAQLMTTSKDIVHECTSLPVPRMLTAGTATRARLRTHGRSAGAHTCPGMRLLGNVSDGLTVDGSVLSRTCVCARERVGVRNMACSWRAHDCPKPLHLRVLYTRYMQVFCASSSAKGTSKLLRGIRAQPGRFLAPSVYAGGVRHVSQDPEDRGGGRLRPTRSISELGKTASPPDFWDSAISPDPGDKQEGCADASVGTEMRWSRKSLAGASTSPQHQVGAGREGAPRPGEVAGAVSLVSEEAV
ncbi:unnamed protein product [Diplocarpon coronariae]